MSQSKCRHILHLMHQRELSSVSDEEDIKNVLHDVTDVKRIIVCRNNQLLKTITAIYLDIHGGPFVSNSS